MVDLVPPLSPHGIRAAARRPRSTGPPTVASTAMYPSTGAGKHHSITDAAVRTRRCCVLVSRTAVRCCHATPRGTDLWLLHRQPLLFHGTHLVTAPPLPPQLRAAALSSLEAQARLPAVALSSPGAPVRFRYGVTSAMARIQPTRAHGSRGLERGTPMQTRRRAESSWVVRAWWRSFDRPA